MFNFEKLETWQKVIDFADLVYSTTRAFPDAERFSLTSQMRRAAVSVSSNITIAASLTAWIVEVTATLNALGLWKGSA